MTTKIAMVPAEDEQERHKSGDEEESNKDDVSVSSDASGGLSRVLQEYLAIKKNASSTPMMINDANESHGEPRQQRFMRLDDDRKLYHNLDTEMETYNAEYRLHRQMLKQKAQEVDTNYMARSHMVQGKLTEALEKTKQANDAKLAVAQQKWKEELEAACEASKELCNKERQERLNTISALEQDLYKKLKMVEAVNTSQENHEIALKAADQERQGLKQEIKNILVTLHYQFENLTNSLSTQEDDMRVFEQAQRDLLADVENSVQDVTSYVDTVQHEVSQVQLESKAMWKQCEDEQNAARDILSKTMLELVTQTKAELSSTLEDHGEQLDNIKEVMDTKTKAMEFTLKKHVEESAQNMKATEEKAKAARVKFSKDFIGRIQETEDTIFQSIDVHMSTMENNQREMKDRLDAQNKEHEDICVVVSKVAEDFIKADRASCEKHREVDDTFKRINTSVYDHAAAVTSLEEKFANTSKSTSDRFAKVCERLEKLENALAIEREARASDREAAEVRSQEHLRYMGSLKEKLDDANKYSHALEDRLTKLQGKHSGLEHNYDTLLKKVANLDESHCHLEENFQIHAGATNQKHENVQASIGLAKKLISGIEDNVVKLTKDLKCRSESHVLATKEFREELAKVAEQFEGLNLRHAEISNRMTEQETSLSSIKVSELVDASMQPFWKQHESFSAKMDASAEQVRKLKDEIETTRASQDAFGDRVKDMKATSESLFQHLANSVQTTQTKCRVDVENLKHAVETMESALQESSCKIAASREFMDSVVIDQKSSLQDLESKLTSVKDDIKSALTRIGSRQTEYKLFREELVKEQFSMKEKVSRSIENLLQWKREIETSVNDTKTNLAKALVPQQEVADEDIATLVMKVAKEERETYEAATDAKLLRWSEKVEKHSIEVETRISNLHELVDQMKKENGARDDFTIAELREMVNGLSDKIETANASPSAACASVEGSDLLEAVDELRADMINRNSMVIELDDRMNSWVTETTETMKKIREGLTAQQLRGQETDEKNSDLENLMITRTKEVTDLEAKVKEMSKKLTESRYECRGLRLKLLTKNHSGDQDAGCATR